VRLGRDADAPAATLQATRLQDAAVLVCVGSRIGREGVSNQLRVCGLRPVPMANVSSAIACLEASGAEQARAIVIDGTGCADEDLAVLVKYADEGRVPIVWLRRAAENARRWGRPSSVAIMKPPRPDELLDAVHRLVLGEPLLTPTASPAPVVASRPLRVLMAEDHPVNRTLVLRLLERRGHQVTVVCDGREAVDAFSASSFDLVLMDVQMPVMDGYAATRTIRALEAERGGRVPIVALTAHAMTGDREKCVEVGMDDYLAKPIDTTALLAIVARVADGLDDSAHTARAAS
jgi:CheY-like chemotaxis protein